MPTGLDEEVVEALGGLDSSSVGLSHEAEVRVYDIKSFFEVRLAKRLDLLLDNVCEGGLFRV